MKMIIVTAVEEYKDDVFKLLKSANIEAFSGSHVDGYKSVPQVLYNSSWFPSERGGASSSLFFAYTDEKKVDVLFELLKEYNAQLESNNPIKAVELPVERFI